MLTRHLALSAYGRLGHMPAYYQPRLPALECRGCKRVSRCLRIQVGPVPAEEKAMELNRA